VAREVLAPAVAVNPREIMATAAMAAIRFPNIIRFVSPWGLEFVNSHSRMSDAFLNSPL
jgi:hypothetical protein